MKYLGIINSQHETSPEKIRSIFESLFKESPKNVTLPNLSLYYTNLPQHMELIEANNGILLGNLYKKDTMEKISQKKLGINLSEDYLTKACFGGFIAFICQMDSCLVFRDITGKIQTFYTILNGGEIFLSNSLILLRCFINAKIAIDELYLCTFLMHDRIAHGKTFIKNILELPSGSSLEIKGGQNKIRLHWDPSKIQCVDTDKHDIANLMEKIVDNHVSLLDRIILNFSGGLDSTSILYCLLATPCNRQKLELVNYYNEGFQSVNERTHARKIASNLNVNLMEKLVDLSNFFKIPTISEPASLPNIPSPLLVSWDHEREIQSYFNKNDSYVIVSGFGGDQVFMQSPSIYSLSDAYFDHGLKLSSKVAMNLCQITRQSRLKLYFENVIGLIKQLIFKNCYKDHSFCTPDWATKELILESNRYSMHPIFHKSVHRLGKDDQIHIVYSAIEYANSVNTSVGKNIFYPFLQQPLIELALSFPSYDLFDDEFTRIPIRRSIHNRFNTNDIWRKDKGESTGVILKTIFKNIEFITSVCCEGFFAGKNFIDKDKTAEHIRILASGQPFNIWPIIRLFSAEMFLNIWEKHGYFQSKSIFDEQ